MVSMISALKFKILISVHVLSNVWFVLLYAGYFLLLA